MKRRPDGKLLFLLDEEAHRAMVHTSPREALPAIAKRMGFDPSSAEEGGWNSEHGRHQVWALPVDQPFRELASERLSYELFMASVHTYPARRDMLYRRAVNQLRSDGKTGFFHLTTDFRRGASVMVSVVMGRQLEAANLPNSWVPGDMVVWVSPGTAFSLSAF